MAELQGFEEDLASTQTQGGAKPRFTRRVSDKILLAFHTACDQGDYEVAGQLLRVLEEMLSRRMIPLAAERRKNIEARRQFGDYPPTALANDGCEAVDGMLLFGISAAFMFHGYAGLLLYTSGASRTAGRLCRSRIGPDLARPKVAAGGLEEFQHRLVVKCG